MDKILELIDLMRASISAHTDTIKTMSERIDLVNERMDNLEKRFERIEQDVICLKEK